MNQDDACIFWCNCAFRQDDLERIHSSALALDLRNGYDGDHSKACIEPVIREHDHGSSVSLLFVANAGIEISPISIPPSHRTDVSHQLFGARPSARVTSNASRSALVSRMKAGSRAACSYAA